MANNSKKSSTKNNTNKRSSVKSVSRNQKSGNTKSGNTKSGSSNKTQTSRSKSSVENSTKRQYDRNKIPSVKPKSSLPENTKNEIILVITTLVSVLLILSYFNICGKFGEFINKNIFGIMGLFAYAFPFVLFILVAFILSNKGNSLARSKIISGIIIMILLTAMIQMIVGYRSDITFWKYFEYSAATKNGGGLLGALLCVPLNKLFDKVATVVIIVALLIVFLMVLTGKAIFSYFKKKSEESIHVGIERFHSRQEEFNSIENEEVNESLGLEGRREPVLIDIVPEKKNKKNVHEDNEPEELVAPVEEQLSFIDILKAKGNTKNSKHIYSVDEIKLMETAEEIDVSKTDNGETEKTNIDMQEIIPNNHEDAAEDNQYNANNEVINEHGDNVQEIHNIRPRRTSVKDETIEPVEVETNTIPEKKYIFPPTTLLNKPSGNVKGISKREIDSTALKLQSTLDSFGVRVKLTNVSCGPAVTRYELQPEQGVKVSSITKLSDDIKLNLAATDIRIEAPIPGKAAIGIEVPNSENSTVMLRDLVESNEFIKHKSNIVFAVGKDIGGQTVVTDIAKMPHLLIAGATGSGKSVCINTLIMSLLFNSSPADVRLIMIDPKVVELSVYNGIPHLLIPVVTDPKKASAALNWAVMEMTNRYSKFAEMQVRDLVGYNEKIKEEPYKDNPEYIKLPQIIIIVDELADLMMVAPGEVEDAIRRISQMARAAGLHLIIATQRPSVNVITGVIKANVPSRIAFAVSSQVDSRTIIDSGGAEKLLGKGDMLFYPSGYPKPIRVQGAFVSDKEVSAVVDFLKEQNSEPQYNEEVSNHITNSANNMHSGESAANHSLNTLDEYFIEAGKFIIEKDSASIGILQRAYRIGFNRAARIMEQLSDAGVVGEENGTKPRKILMTLEEFNQYVEENV